MTTITRWEWFAGPPPDATTAARAAAAGTVQQCQDGQSFVIWDTIANVFQVFTRSAGWSALVPIPYDPSLPGTPVPVAWSNPVGDRINFLTQVSGAFGPQYLWTVKFRGTSYNVRSITSVAQVTFPAFPASAGPYQLWNAGKQAIFQFDDLPMIFLAYQDYTGKSLMVGWPNTNVLEPETVLTFPDQQVSIQLCQQGSQKSGATLFGDPLPMMGAPRGWMFNHSGTINVSYKGLRLFAPLDGWNYPGTYPNTIQFGVSPILGTFLVSRVDYPTGSLFSRDVIPGGILGYASQQGFGLYPGGNSIILGDRSWAQYVAGAPLAAVNYFPFDPDSLKIGLPIQAGPPSGLSSNYHAALLDNVPFLLDDAGHFVYLGFASFTFRLAETVNWLMFSPVSPSKGK